MRDSLDAPLIGRLRQKLRPDWARTTTARRVCAGLLVVLAAVIEFRPDPRDGLVAVVVAKHDLAPGSALTTADVVIESRSAASIPDGALHESSAAVGSTLAAPARRGEVITDVRLLGSRLTTAAAGPDARMVPLHLADAALPDLLRPGDVVDVLAGPENTGAAAEKSRLRSSPPMPGWCWSPNASSHRRAPTNASYSSPCRGTAPTPSPVRLCTGQSPSLCTDERNLPGGRFRFRHRSASVAAVGLLTTARSPGRS
ncbi:hypothetical protein MAUB1S_02553 [Mycolicibacterium aubagnense]